jgi:hypothetical protein
MSGFSRAGIHHYIRSHKMSTRYIGYLQTISRPQLNQIIAHRAASKRARSKSSDPEWASLQLIASNPLTAKPRNELAEASISA